MYSKFQSSSFYVIVSITSVGKNVIRASSVYLLSLHSTAVQRLMLLWRMTWWLYMQQITIINVIILLGWYRATIMSAACRAANRTFNDCHIPSCAATFSPWVGTKLRFTISRPWHCLSSLENVHFRETRDFSWILTLLRPSCSHLLTQLSWNDINCHRYKCSVYARWRHWLLSLIDMWSRSYLTNPGGSLTHLILLLLLSF